MFEDLNPGRVLGAAFVLMLLFLAASVIFGLNTFNAKDGELIGQAKKIITATPIVCPNYEALDVSLGVMQNGTGSMSTHDVWLTIKDVEDLKKMKEAVEKASIIKVHYDSRRIAICTEDLIATGFEVVQ